MKRTHIHIPVPTLDALRTKARELDITIAELIRNIIKEWLEKQK